ncbi:MAG: hypothetical protein HKL83_03235 [Acidimicrobiaceae bacterium]|nr:hypothetical protein [Acidimicrobiaceae bacterium]
MYNQWLKKRVLSFAHQGGAAEAPASTEFAFEMAFQKGVDALELDLHMSLDGVIVCNHDSDLFSATGIKLAISEVTFEQIASMDAGYCFQDQQGSFPYRGLRSKDDRFRLLSLEEVLAKYPELILNLDIKDDLGPDSGFEARLAELLGQYRAKDRTIVASFHLEPLRRIRRCDPEIFTSASTEEAYSFYGDFQSSEPKVDDLAFCALQLPDTLQGNEYLTSELVDYAHRRGVAVHIWTVDQPERIGYLVELGCDGIISDTPGVLVEVLNSLGVAYRGGKQ